MSESDRPAGSRPPGELGERPFRVADWLVEPAACRLERGGEAVHLEPKVMQVLTHLAGRPGAVVSRQELEDSVWAGTVVGYDAVTNAIIKLRKALGDDARHPRIIETIPKRGYRLVTDVTPVSPAVDDSAERQPPVGEYQAGKTPASPAAPGTAEGREVSSPAGRAAASSFLRRRRAPVAGVGVVALVVAALVALAWWRSWEPSVKPASIERMAYPLPDKPSIAILPFENLSGDPGQKYLSDGLSENLITELARFKKFFVIEGSSSFAYEGKDATVRQVAEELGVRYVVNGSVQTEEDDLRVTVRLVDATTGKHLWAESFERNLQDLFEVQHQIIRTVAATLEESIDLAEYDRIRRKPTANLGAYEYAQRALEHFFTHTREGNERAEDLFEKALALDSDYSNAYVGLAWVHLSAYRYGWSDSRSREELLSAAMEMARAAVARDQNNPKAHQVLAHAMMLSGDLEQAMAEYDQALELNPNSARVLADSSEPLVYLGRATEAVSRMRTAMRLSPRHPDWYLWNLGFAQYCAKQYDEALASIRKMNNMPNGARRILAAALVRLNRLDEAQTVIADFRKQAPDYTVEAIDLLPFKHKECQRRYLEDLREAGVPDE